jgi:hypothetical protein
VALDLNNRDLWVPWCDWPGELKARSPVEVKTLVLVLAVSNRVTTYTSGHPGLRLDYKVWVFDWDQKRVVDSAALLGGDLPERVPGAKFELLRPNEWVILRVFRQDGVGWAAGPRTAGWAARHYLAEA